MREDSDLLELALAAEVLVLAKLMKMERENKGTWSTSDYVDDAISLVRQRRSGIIQSLTR